MRKEHLAELTVQKLVLPEDGRRDVAKRQSHETPRPRLAHLHRNQRRHTLRDLMSAFPSKPVTVPCRTRQRIRESSGGNDTGIPVYPLPAVKLRAGESSVLCKHPGNTCAQMYGNVKPPHLLLHCTDDIRRMVRYRKYPVSTLYLRPYAKPLKKLYHIPVGTPVKTAVQKFRIA